MQYLINRLEELENAIRLLENEYRKIASVLMKRKEEKMRPCVDCGEAKEEEEFPFCKKGSKYRKRRCKVCDRIYLNNRNRAYIAEKKQRTEAEKAERDLENFSKRCFEAGKSYAEIQIEETKRLLGMNKNELLGKYKQYRSEEEGLTYGELQTRETLRLIKERRI